jgi:hypothetical protein
MAAGRPPFMSARKVRLMDAAIVVWIVAWVLLGVFVGRAVWGVGGIADPVIRNATSLGQTAQGFERLRSVPLVGSALGSVVGGVTGAADKTRAEAQAVKDRIHAIGVTVGLLLALVPVAVALVFYLPLRLPWGRDVRAIRTALARDPTDPRLQRYLAVRALQGLTYDRLLALSDDPWHDLATAHAERLAAVELERLGLSSKALRARAVAGA